MAGLSVTLRGNFAKLDELKSKSEKTASSVKKAFSGLNQALAFTGLTVGASAAFAAVAAGAKAAVTAASDLGETVSKTQAVFKSSSAEIIAWAEKASRTFGQSKQQALDAASGFGNLFVSMGIGEGKAATMSRRITELASDLASFNNTTVADAIEAIGAGLRGEAEPMRRFGVLMDDATLKAQAFAMGIWDGKGSLEPTTKALAAYELIISKTTTAHGDFQRTSDGLANSQRTLSALTQDLMADIGQGLLPEVVKLAQEMKSWDFQGIGEAIGSVTSVVLSQAKAFGLLIEKVMEYTGVMGMIKRSAANDPTKGHAMPAVPGMVIGGGPDPAAPPPAQPTNTNPKSLKETEEAREREKTVAKQQAAAEEFRLESEIIAAQIQGDTSRLQALEKEKEIRQEMKRLESAGIPKEFTRNYAEVRVAETREKSQRDAVRAYNNESAVLTAKMTGDESRIRAAEREKKIREEMQTLMNAGFTAEEARKPAEKKVDAEIAIEARDKRKEELEERQKEIQEKQKGLKYESSVGTLASMQRIGGGGGAVASGLDYARQSADLQRQANDLLRELIAVNKPIEF